MTLPESTALLLALPRRQRLSEAIWQCASFWNCESPAAQDTPLHGYLLKDPKCLFDDVPPNNPHLAVVPAGQDVGKAKTETP
jgi:hypothetical protein